MFETDKIVNGWNTEQNIGQVISQEDLACLNRKIEIRTSAQNHNFKLLKV